MSSSWFCLRGDKFFPLPISNPVLGTNFFMMFVPYVPLKKRQQICRLMAFVITFGGRLAYRKISQTSLGLILNLSFFFSQSLNLYPRHMKYFQIQRKETSMTKAESRQLKKGAQVALASLHPWISLTCSLVVEDG